MADYLEKEVFNDTEIPAEYASAIKELRDNKEKISELIKNRDIKEYESKLSFLKLNKLTRQSPVEALYDILIYFQNNNKRLLKNNYTWTHKLEYNESPRIELDLIGNFRVIIGGFDSSGVSVSKLKGGSSGFDLGLVLSRKS